MNTETSVVMAVYNGGKYIKEQLYSILRQTNIPNEIIVIDDASPEPCDETIRSIIPPLKCKIVYNKHEFNQGYAQTFFEGLFMAKGEFVFLSDQDDVWEHNKIESCVEIMKCNSDILCLSSRYSLIDSKGEIIKKEHNYLNKIRNISVKELLKQRGLKPGMSLVVRRSLIQKIKEMDTNNLESHDRFIEYMATINNGYYLYNKQLSRYRIHETNTSGLNLTHFSLRTDRNGRIEQIKKEKRYLEFIRPINSKDEKEIDKYISYYNIREELLIKAKLLSYVIGSIRIISRYNTCKIWFGDILSIIRGKK